MRPGPPLLENDDHLLDVSQPVFTEEDLLPDVERWSGRPTRSPKACASYYSS